MAPDFLLPLSPAKSGRSLTAAALSLSGPATPEGALRGAPFPYLALSRRKPDIDGFTHREITTSQSPSSAPVPHSPFLLGQIHEPVSPFSVLDSASDSSVFCSTPSRPLTRCPSAARPSTYLPPANPTQPTHPLSPIHPSIHQPLVSPLTTPTCSPTHLLAHPRPSTLDSFGTRPLAPPGQPSALATYARPGLASWIYRFSFPVRHTSVHARAMHAPSDWN